LKLPRARVCSVLLVHRDSLLISVAQRCGRLIGRPWSGTLRTDRRVRRQLRNMCSNQRMVTSPPHLNVLRPVRKGQPGPVDVVGLISSDLDVQTGAAIFFSNKVAASAVRNALPHSPGCPAWSAQLAWTRQTPPTNPARLWPVFDLEPLQCHHDTAR